MIGTQSSPSPASDSTTQQTILVTGGLGYIGGVLVTLLASLGHRIRILDAGLYDPAPTGHPGVSLIQGDIRNPSAVAQALAGVDAVVHLAAIVGDPACALDPDRTRAVNIDATRLLVAAANAAGVGRFIFASTCSVYGAGADDVLTESSPVNPVSLYAESKVAAEAIVLGSGGGMATTVLRFATIYGLAPRLRFDLVVNLLTARAARGLPIRIFGGEQWRPFLNVADAAAAIERSLASDSSAIAGLFNVGSSSENYQLTDVGRIVADMIPCTDLSIDQHIGDRRTYRVSFDKFTAATGFAPTCTLADGIMELRDVLLADPSIDIADPRWDNARMLQEAAINSGS